MATYTSNYGWTKPSGSDNVDISVLNNNLDDQDSTIHDAFLNMAPPFSESSTYAVDDIVLYGTGLYKCHTAVVTPGSWTGSTNWQVHKLSEGGSGGGGYVLPTATESRLGGVKIGSGINVEEDGTISANGGGGTDDYNDLDNQPQINGVTLSGNKTASELGLQDELTFDNMPTDDSNNPVKSNGIYDSEKDIYAVMGEMGAKNLNSYPYNDTTKTTNGITFTDNGDGTITANGTATADVYFSCHSRAQGEANDLIIPNGRYLLTGCPSGGGTSTYSILAQRTYNGSSDILGRDNRDGALVVANGDDFSANEVNLQLNIFIKGGQTVSNLTFKPMLRLASDTDDTYQPYAKTNKELTEAIKNIPTSASDLSYDNTDSGLTATDVQGAVDELAESYPATQVMLSDGVTSVEEALTANIFGNNISIKGTSRYACPSDGYIRAFNQQSSSGYISIKTNNDMTIYTGYATKMGDYETFTLFAKKGMIFKDESTANAYGLDFIPIS